MARTVTIAVGSVTLATVALPRKLPFPVPRAKLVEYYMSAGENGPGVRKFDFLGAHISYSDYSFTAGYLSSSQISALDALFRAGAPVTVTINDPTVYTHVYKMLFKEDGFIPDLMGEDVEYTEDNAWKAVLNFAVLEQVS